MFQISGAPFRSSLTGVSDFRYRDHGGVDYGMDYGDNYPSYGGGGGGVASGYGGGGGLAGGYGLSSRSNPEIAHRKVLTKIILMNFFVFGRVKKYDVVD